MFIGVIDDLKYVVRRLDPNSRDRCHGCRSEHAESPDAWACLSRAKRRKMKKEASDLAALCAAYQYMWIIEAGPHKDADRILRRFSLIGLAIPVSRASIGRLEKLGLISCQERDPFITIGVYSITKAGRYVIERLARRLNPGWCRLVTDARDFEAMLQAERKTKAKKGG